MRAFLALMVMASALPSTELLAASCEARGMATPSPIPIDHQTRELSDRSKYHVIQFITEDGSAKNAAISAIYENKCFAIYNANNINDTNSAQITCLQDGCRFIKITGSPTQILSIIDGEWSKTHFSQKLSPSPPPPTYRALRDTVMCSGGAGWIELGKELWFGNPPSLSQEDEQAVSARGGCTPIFRGSSVEVPYIDGPFATACIQITNLLISNGTVHHCASTNSLDLQPEAVR